MKKRKMKRMLNGYDHTNDLPDCILSQILSLLPTEDVVRSSFVSKRWKSCCSPLCIIDLDYKRFSTNSRLNDQKKRFFDFVECVILLYNNYQHLKEFRLSLLTCKEVNPQIDKWVKFAMRSGLTTLDLNFYGREIGDGLFGDNGCYTLPDFPMELQSLEVFRLSYCKHLPSQDMRFNLLKTVVLTMIWLDGQIYDFIDNCPCLEELHLIKCFLPEYIRLKDPESKLKCLVIDSCDTIDGYTHFIKINIPSLLRFKFAGQVLFEFYMSKPRNLIEAELEIRKIYDNHDGDDDADEDARHYQILRHLLTNMDNVNTLTLSSSFIQHRHIALKQEVLQCKLLLDSNGKLKKNQTQERVAYAVMPLDLRLVLICDHDKAIEVLMSGQESHEILPPPLPNLKHLTVEISVRRDSLNLACLLKSCLNLETLCVDFRCKFWNDNDMSSPDFDDEEKFISRSYLFPSKYLHCLKKVEIKNFEGRSQDNVFISYILDNALVLEEMIIYKAAMQGNEKELALLKLRQEMAIEILMTFRKGSIRARILTLQS